VPRAAHQRPASQEACTFLTAERLASFAHALDTLRQEVEVELGADDVAHIERVQKLSQITELVGRTLIQFSLDPFTFSVGIASLSTHKLLELMEIGHTVLHGTYDQMPGAERYDCRRFHWKAPIDEKSWRFGHNVRHHQYTNVAGRDPDLDFGGLRLSAHIPHRALHRLQPFSNFATWLSFATAINLHVTGVLEIYSRTGDQDGVRRRDWGKVRDTHVVFLRKLLRYYSREYIFFPALAGPMFWKALLGNMLSEVTRDVYAAAIIYCGHVGAEEYTRETRGGSRAGFYVLQVEGACDVDLPPALSLLAGALDKQIEHHLFPRLPPNRLRHIAPRVKAICEEHGVNYRSGSWMERLQIVVKRLRELSVADVA
jgi:NADPH-dependent stearoyl-CoA 9-desaturase